jgi:DNA-binding Lrp family transcriptional regulator
MYAESELLLVSHLRNNGRMTLTELSEKTGYPISTIHDKLRMQEVIRQHTCLLDFDHLGFTTKATILIKVKKENKGALIPFLLSHHSVNAVSSINTGFDFLIDGIFKNIKDLEEFMEDCDRRFSIKGKHIIYIIEQLGKELFLTKENHIPHILK